MKWNIIKLNDCRSDFSSESFSDTEQAFQDQKDSQQLSKNSSQSFENKNCRKSKKGSTKQKNIVYFDSNRNKRKQNQAEESNDEAQISRQTMHSGKYYNKKNALKKNDKSFGRKKKDHEGSILSKKNEKKTKPISKKDSIKMQRKILNQRINKYIGYDPKVKKQEEMDMEKEQLRFDLIKYQSQLTSCEKNQSEQSMKKINACQAQNNKRPNEKISLSKGKVQNIKSIQTRGSQRKKQNLTKNGQKQRLDLLKITAQTKKPQQIIQKQINDQQMKDKQIKQSKSQKSVSSDRNQEKMKGKSKGKYKQKVKMSKKQKQKQKQKQKKVMQDTSLTKIIRSRINEMEINPPSSKYERALQILNNYSFESRKRGNSQAKTCNGKQKQLQQTTIPSSLAYSQPVKNETAKQPLKLEQIIRTSNRAKGMGTKDDSSKYVYVFSGYSSKSIQLTTDNVCQDDQLFQTVLQFYKNYGKFMASSKI